MHTVCRGVTRSSELRISTYTYVARTREKRRDIQCSSTRKNSKGEKRKVADTSSEAFAAALYYRTTFVGARAIHIVISCSLHRHFSMKSKQRGEMSSYTQELVVPLFKFIVVRFDPISWLFFVIQFCGFLSDHDFQIFGTLFL